MKLQNRFLRNLPKNLVKEFPKNSCCSSRKRRSSLRSSRWYNFILIAQEIPKQNCWRIPKEIIREVFRWIVEVVSKKVAEKLKRITELVSLEIIWNAPMSQNIQRMSETNCRRRSKIKNRINLQRNSRTSSKRISQEISVLPIQFWRKC